MGKRGWMNPLQFLNADRLTKIYSRKGGKINIWKISSRLTDQECGLKRSGRS